MTTVLIVDDHDGFRTVARRLLEDCGYQVVGEARDGATALATARRLRPGAVLLDIQLPDMDGFDVAAQLTGARVVMISGRDRATYRARLDALPAARFIAKADLSGQTLVAALGPAA